MLPYLKDLSTILGGIALIIAAAVWIYRQIRDTQIYCAFVQSIALNHMPHIYDALYKIATKQGIKLDEPPSIKFIDFRGKK